MNDGYESRNTPMHDCVWGVEDMPVRVRVCVRACVFVLCGVFVVGVICRCVVGVCHCVSFCRHELLYIITVQHPMSRDCWFCNP